MIALWAPSAFAGTTIRVPADQPTIQAGINAAVNGDTVLVSPGTYYEHINFDGKAITVTSSGGPQVTIIDGQEDPAATLSSHETIRAVLSGFTLQNGFPVVSIENASPTIKGNIIASVHSTFIALTGFQPRPRGLRNTDVDLARRTAIHNYRHHQSAV